MSNLTIFVGTAFFRSAISTLSTIVTGLGAGMALWGIIQIMQAQATDNPATRTQGMNMLLGGGGLAVIGMTLVPLLANVF